MIAIFCFLSKYIASESDLQFKLNRRTKEITICKAN